MSWLDDKNNHHGTDAISSNIIIIIQKIKKVSRNFMLWQLFLPFELLSKAKDLSPLASLPIKERELWTADKKLATVVEFDN